MGDFFSGFEQYNDITRHDTKYLVVNGDDFQEADGPDPLAKMMSEKTRMLDGTDPVKLLDPKQIAIGIPGLWLQKNDAEEETQTGSAGKNSSSFAPIALLFQVLPKLAEIYANRYRTAAKKEAGQHTDLYIDPEAFISLSRTSGAIAEQLFEINKTLLLQRPVPQISIPSIPSTASSQAEVFYAERIRDLINMINGMIRTIDAVRNVSATGAALVKTSAETLESVKKYLERSGSEFITAENVARQIIADWED